MTTPHHIGYVLKVFPRLSETFILNELLGLESDGVATTVLSLRTPQETITHPDVALRKGPLANIPQFGKASALQAMDDITRFPRDAVANARAFVAQLPEEHRTSALMQGLRVASESQDRGIDHLHCHFLTIASRITCIAHLLSGVPFSVTAHAKDIYRIGIDWSIAQDIARHATAIVTVCNANVEHLEQQLPGARIELVYNGLDVAPLDRTARNGQRVLGVGRLVEKKGFDTFIETVELLSQERPIEATIIGTGEELPALQEMIDQRGLSASVTLLGPQPAPIVRKHMLRADVLLAPCRIGTDGNQDALPTVLIEALRAGLPAVSTPIAGIPEIIGDGNEGLIVPADDPTAARAAVLRILDDPALWDEMSQRARAKQRRLFDRSRTVAQLVDILTGTSHLQEVR